MASTNTRFNVDSLVSEGVYDIGVGVDNMERAVEFWRGFGYHVGEMGQLPADQSEALYGVYSSVTTTRLFHQSARQGLIRLVRWNDTPGPGLQMAPLRTAGTRWSVHKTDDLLTAYSHGLTTQLQRKPISILGPIINARSARAIDDQQPFREPVPCSYNLQLFQPESQVVVMQRQHIDVSSYGEINQNSLLRTSQACHVALVHQGFDEAIPAFYEKAFGVVRTGSIQLQYDPDSVATAMFNLAPGESLREIDLDDPRCSADGVDPQPGRLRLFFLESDLPLPKKHASASPGQLGYCLYSYRTRDPERLRESVISAGAYSVTALLSDEFGRPSFSFRAPDGYFWQILSE